MVLQHRPVWIFLQFVFIHTSQREKKEKIQLKCWSRKATLTQLAGTEAFICFMFISTPEVFDMLQSYKIVSYLNIFTYSIQ